MLTVETQSLDAFDRDAMKIDRASSPRNNATRRRGTEKTGSGSGFAEALVGGAGQTRSVAGPAALGPTQALLALQEVPDEQERGARARQRAEDLLDQLDVLRMALLSGRLPVAEIEKLVIIASEQRELVDDPRLSAILGEIETRAAVELAKLGR